MTAGSAVIPHLLSATHAGCTGELWPGRGDQLCLRIARTPLCVRTHNADTGNVLEFEGIFACVMQECLVEGAYR